MIQEDYVSFEVAKLLKENGFDEPTRFWYNDKGIISQKYIDPTNNPLGKGWSYAAPTQSLALKWLREVHNIFIEINVSIDLNGAYHYAFSILDKECKYIKRFIGYYSSHELCVEAALLYVLKNLI